MNRLRIVEELTTGRPRSLYRSLLIAPALALFLAAASVASQGDEDGLMELLDAPTAEDLARELDAMVAANDGSSIWATATKPGADYRREDFGRWFADTCQRIPLALRPIVTLTAGRIKTLAAVPGLLRWLTDEKCAADAFRREAIVYALGEIGDARAKPALQDLRNNEEEWTRFFTAEALLRIEGTPPAPAPRHPGVKGIRVATVGRAVWGNAETDHYYQTLIRKTFGGDYASQGLAAVINGSMGGWRGKGLTGFLDWLAFDEVSRPRFDAIVLHGVYVNETNPLLWWRLYHYARRGGLVFMDEASMFWPRKQYENKGFTARGGVIRGRVIHRFFYPRGPWDSLYPERLERHPLFPSLDGLPLPVKELYCGYRPIGSGGSLLIASSAQSLVRCIANATPRSGFEPAILEPFTRTAVTGTEEALPQIISWLAEGPQWQVATLDWRDEPPAGTILRAGQAVPISLVTSLHGPTDEIQPCCLVFSPQDKLVARQCAAAQTGEPGDRIATDLSLTLPGTAEPGAYTFRVILTAPDGTEHAAVERTFQVVGRFDLTQTGVPPVVTADTDAVIHLRATDHGRGPVLNGQARLSLVNADEERTYMTWRTAWAGPGADEIAFQVRIPGDLPPAQYDMVGEVGDANGRTFGRCTTPLARQAGYGERERFMWSEWAQNSDGYADLRRKLGLNTTYGYGSWQHTPGFPYEYAVINPPQYTRGVELGDYYLGRSAGAQERQEWLRCGRTSLEDARAVSVNLIEEVQIADETRGPGRRAQFRRFLQDIVGTTDALNERTGCDVTAWEELPYAMHEGNFGELSGQFHYYYRDHILHMRADWLREENPYLHVEPGMGAGMSSSFYDGMHMRGYVHNRMSWFPLYHTRTLPAYGTEPMTWLVGMRWFWTFAAQSRVVWSSIAAGGRHILNYAPGDKFGQVLYNPDHTLSLNGSAYREVIDAVHSYEPILGLVRNRISHDVISFDWSGVYGGQPDTQPVLEALFYLGIHPDETTDVTTARVIIDAHGRMRDWQEKPAAVRRAVENGAVLICAVGGSSQLAAAFGVRFDAGTAAATADPLRVDLTPLADLLPGLEGAWLSGKRGGANGAAADSGLTVRDGLIYGRVGQGLFILLNVDSPYTGAYMGDSTPIDFEGWTRLLRAALARQGLPTPAYAADAAGVVDRRILCHELETADARQRYLMVQANDVLEGSLSGWGVDALAHRAIAEYAPAAPHALRNEDDTIALKWSQPKPVEAQLWVRRHFKAESPDNHPAAVFRVFRDGKPLPMPTYDAKEGEAPPPIGRLPAAGAGNVSHWEAAGTVLPLTEGTYELTLTGTGREVFVERVVLLPAEVTARVVLDDPGIRALYDVRSDTRYTVNAAGNLRIVDIPLRAGDASLLAMLEKPDANVTVAPVGPHVARGRTVGLELSLVDAEGSALRSSHTLVASLLDGNGDTVPHSGQRTLLAGGRTTFAFWIAQSDPLGPCRIDIHDLTTGGRTQVPVIVGEATTEHAPEQQRPPGNRLVLDAIPDLREPDIAVFDLAGTFFNSADKDCVVELVTPLPDACFPGGPKSRTFGAKAGVWTPFRVTTVLTRKTARAVRRRDLTIPISLRADDTTVAHAEARLLTNPWDCEPTTVGTLTGGQLVLTATNATRAAVNLRVNLSGPDALYIKDALKSVVLNASGTTTIVFPSARNGVDTSDGVYEIAYTVDAGAGAQTGETRLEVRTESSWWIATRKTGPAMAGPAGRLSLEAGDGDVDLGLGDLDTAGPWSLPAKLFGRAQPPEGWTTHSFGSGVQMDELEPLPKWDTIVLAATRVQSPEDCDVVVKVGRENHAYVWLDRELIEDRREKVDRSKAIRGGEPGHFIGRVRLNDTVVYDTRPDPGGMMGRDRLGEAHLRAGSNTLLLQCKINADSPQNPGNFFVFLFDAHSGKRIRSLTYNVERVR